jgi:hypothetical protein
MNAEHEDRLAVSVEKLVEVLRVREEQWSAGQARLERLVEAMGAEVAALRVDLRPVVESEARREAVATARAELHAASQAQVDAAVSFVKHPLTKAVLWTVIGALAGAAGIRSCAGVGVVDADAQSTWTTAVPISRSR